MKAAKKTLSGRRVAVLMADGFEMAEYSVPVGALKIAGAAITVISLRRGGLRGVNLHEPAHRVRADVVVNQASERDFDALFVPGGFINPDLLRQSEFARDFIKRFARTGKPIASLCHGPWVLASCGLLEGKVLTAWAGIRDDVVNAGGTWLDQAVVRDGNLLTSRGPQDFAAFVPALLAFFASSAGQLAVSHGDGRTASSPQRSQPPALVLNAMRVVPRPALRGFALGMLAAAGAMIASRRIGLRSRPQEFSGRPGVEKGREAQLQNAS